MLRHGPEEGRKVSGLAASPRVGEGCPGCATCESGEVLLIEKQATQPRDTRLHGPRSRRALSCELPKVTSGASRRFRALPILKRFVCRCASCGTTRQVTDQGGAATSEETSGSIAHSSV